MLKRIATAVFALSLGCEAPSLPNGPGAAASPIIQLTPAAAEMVHKVLQSEEGMTHILVSVEFDDEKYCTGAGYSLKVGKAPAADKFELSVSQGVNVAVDKGDAAFLLGTTLDFDALPTGERGFVFRNPNDPESVPKALRDQ